MPNIVRQRDLAAGDPGTPKRAILAWFQAVQFRDINGVLEATNPPEVRKVGRLRLVGAVRTVGPSLGKPSIVAVRTDRGKAFVRLLVLGYRDREPEPSLATPISLRLVRSDGEWLIDQVDYLIESAKAFRSARDTVKK